MRDALPKDGPAAAGEGGSGGSGGVEGPPNGVQG